MAKKICFVSALFKGKEFEKIDKPAKFEKLEECDYLLFTNIDKTEFNTSWDIVNKDFGYNNSIINSRVPKFQVWGIEELKDYEYIVYCDAYWSPKKTWIKMIRWMETNNIDIVQSKNPYRDCAYAECDEIVRLKKDSRARMDITKKFLSDNGLPKKSGLWRNTFFAYRKDSRDVKILFDKLWEYYSENKYSHRDQPLHSLAVYLTGIKPYTGFNVEKYFNMDGKIGNHTYSV
jgi:hypothetical protein